MASEYAKCYMDKSRIYFIEHYLTTFDATAGRNVPFKLFPRQKVFLNNLANNNLNIAIKSRQAGISTVTASFCTGQCVFATKDSPETILVIGNKLDLAQQIVTKMREFLAQVPRWFWGDEYYSPDPKSEKNKKDIFVKNSKSELELFNGCKIYARSSSRNSARGISSVSALVLDESAFIEDGMAVYTSAVAATAANPNRKIVMISTPNGKDSLYYNTYRQALAGENGYVVTEFRWYQDPRYNKFLKWYKKNESNGELDWIEEDVLDEKGTIKYDEESWRKKVQDGWSPTSPWYISMCQSFNNDSMMIAQELDVSFMGSANNVVDPQYIEMQETYNVREPLEEMKDPLVEETWFWKPPIDGHRYICACLPQGEQVLTQRGLVNVEDVQSDDLLITKEGEYTPIKHRKYREVKDEEIVKIIPYGCILPTTFTWNHKIWASLENKNKQTWLKDKKIYKNKWHHNFKFIHANELKENDWIQIPNIYKTKILTNEEIVKYWEPYSKSQGAFPCPLLDEEFWWYCGMWLAEGYTHHKSIITVHNTNETSIHNRIFSFLKSINRIPQIRQSKEWNSLRIGFGSVQLFGFLHDTFGKYAYGKYISEWVKFLPEKYKLRLLEGYFNGDGSIVGREMRANSVSPKLLSDVQDILFSCGIISTITNLCDEGSVIICNKLRHRKKSYYLRISSNNFLKFINKLQLDIKFDKPSRECNKCLHFSDDENYIFLKIKKIEKYLYSGKVYNYETINDSHTYCCHRISVSNCDPSRGIAHDRTAIEIIDVDGRDENGLPIVEQVAEYVGKKLGDDVGGMLFQYATLYNNAYIVIDSTSGVGDAAILTLLAMGYKNLHYEDHKTKTYTVQNPTKGLTPTYTDRLPGFHFQGNRYPILSNFAGMVRNNEFKIRSQRVINELETWIFKGDTGRMDHMDGATDDTITSLAMGLFVMRYTVNDLQKVQNKDKAILKAYLVSSNMSTTKTPRNSLTMSEKYTSPLYAAKKSNNYSNIQGNFMWVFGGVK